jgi:hypothetical protein
MKTPAELTQKLVNAMLAEREHTFVEFKNIDVEKQIVYAEVYAPGVIDTHGELMTAEDVEVMAHRFMQLDLSKTIDKNHDNVPVDAYPVESFIAREGDPDYTPGAWVLGTKIVDEAIWGAVKKGELNGYSFEALVRKLPAVALLEITRDNLGVTEEADGHTHIFFAELDDDGRVVAGRTTTDNGHSHSIDKGTATNEAGGHRHRIFV